MSDDPRNEALEAAIHARPDDPAAYLVLADWLQSQGDPRGELIAIDVALATAKERGPLFVRRMQLVEQHREYFEGPAGRFKDLQPKWGFGFYEAAWATNTRALDRIAEFLAHPSARFLRELSFQAWKADSKNVHMRVLEKVPTPALMRLTIEGGTPRLSSLSLPRLRGLFIDARSAELGEVRFPELTTLDVKVGSAPAPLVRWIGTTEAPRLHTLFLDLGRDAPLKLRVAELALLLEGERPALKMLALHGLRLGAEHLEAIAASPLLARLEMLDLSRCGIELATARVLLRQPERFAHLAELELGSDELNREAKKRVGAARR